MAETPKKIREKFLLFVIILQIGLLIGLVICAILSGLVDLKHPLNKEFSFGIVVFLSALYGFLGILSCFLEKSPSVAAFLKIFIILLGVASLGMSVFLIILMGNEPLLQLPDLDLDVSFNKQPINETDSMNVMTALNRTIRSLSDDAPLGESIHALDSAVESIDSIESNPYQFYLVLSSEFLFLLHAFSIMCVNSLLISQLCSLQNGGNLKVKANCKLDKNGGHVNKMFFHDSSAWEDEKVFEEGYDPWDFYA